MGILIILVLYVVYNFLPSSGTVITVDNQTNNEISNVRVYLSANSSLLSGELNPVMQEIENGSFILLADFGNLNSNETATGEFTDKIPYDGDAFILFDDDLGTHLHLSNEMYLRTNSVGNQVKFLIE